MHVLSLFLVYALFLEPLHPTAVPVANPSRGNNSVLSVSSSKQASTIHESSLHYSSTWEPSCIRAFARSPVFYISTFIWTVHIPGQLMPSQQGTGEWGGGFLDNLRHNCGEITKWTVQLDVAQAPNTGFLALFYSSCTLRQVEHAAYEASEPRKRIDLKCEFSRGGGDVKPIDAYEEQHAIEEKGAVTRDLALKLEKYGEVSFIDIQ